MRAYELAKELGVTSQELLAELRALKIELKSHMSVVEPDVAETVRRHRATPAAPKPTPEEKPAVPEAVTPPAPAETPSAPEAAEPALPVIQMKPPIVVRALAEQLDIKPNVLIAELMGMNVFASINQNLDPEVARQVCLKHGKGFEIEKRVRGQAATAASPEKPEPAPEEKREPRAPIVAVLGHVDHGKTLLLDAFRNSNVAAGEAGGITQHIGASVVEHGGRRITFLDTPGHAAFTKMRARGAHVADIAVLVVAADDGVMPQTREALDHARAAKVPVIVAVNKMDLPKAKPERVLQQLQELGLTPEPWGGDTIVIEVSAKERTNVPLLLDMILLQSDVQELQASVRSPASGYIVEAALAPGTGPMATALVLNGTLKVGDVVVTGPYCGRVKALITDRGVKVKQAGPSTPVKILGLNGVPEAGSSFEVHRNEREARVLAEERGAALRQEQLGFARHASIENLYQQIKEQGRTTLNVVLKADVQGSVEAIVQELGEIKSEKISLEIIHSGVGNVSENDVLLASASKGLIIGFQVRVDPGATAAAKREGVDIRIYRIIYELTDEIRKVMAGCLEVETRQVRLGLAQVKEVFKLGKSRRVAGCQVTEGTIHIGSRLNVTRGGVQVHEGPIASLRRFKDEVKEVREGFECGIVLAGFNGIEPGDLLEAFRIEKITPEL